MKRAATGWKTSISQNKSRVVGAFRDSTRESRTYANAIACASGYEAKRKKIREGVGNHKWVGRAIAQGTSQYRFTETARPFTLNELQDFARRHGFTKSEPTSGREASLNFAEGMKNGTYDPANEHQRQQVKDFLERNIIDPVEYLETSPEPKGGDAR